MHHIKLIFTRHEQHGFCNSDELYRIIKKVNPDMIFEELSDHNFNRAYDLQTLSTLETDAVKQYLQDHSIKHLAVDTYPLPDNYEKDLYLMYDKLTSENRDFRNLIQKTRDLSMEGFHNLNSDRNDLLIELIQRHKLTILDVMNDEELFRIQKLEQEVIKKREFEILENIYNYSKANTYTQAVLFMGSGHRKSMMRLINNVKNQDVFPIKWSFYNSSKKILNAL